mmetsp:Transcript_15246/g.29024  ORF Transcript_15246/g.29024 Transcript_15246/m.29024 type:complete len:208 (+) Transcript_15246:195-818(+)
MLPRGARTPQSRKQRRAFTNSVTLHSVSNTIGNAFFDSAPWARKDTIQSTLWTAIATSNGVLPVNVVALSYAPRSKKNPNIVGERSPLMAQCKAVQPQSVWLASEPSVPRINSLTRFSLPFRHALWSSVHTRASFAFFGRFTKLNPFPRLRFFIVRRQTPRNEYKYTLVGQDHGWNIMRSPTSAQHRPQNCRSYHRPRNRQERSKRP